MVSKYLASISVALWAVGLVRGQQEGYDPITNFCVRYLHQSVVKNGTLYIDGGIESFVPVVNGIQDGAITIGYNSYLIAVDMSTSWDWKRNISQSLIEKVPSLATGDTAPVLINGALYQGLYNDPNVYFYAGTTSYENTSSPGWKEPNSSQYALWSYNIADESWNQYDVSSGSHWRPSAGSRTEAPDLGLAFYLGGELDNGSSTCTENLGGDKKIFLEGMIVLDLSNHTAQNVSTQAWSGNTPTTRGALQYVPVFGERGVLIAFGGTNKSVTAVDGDEFQNLVPMDEIGIFDIDSLFADIATNKTQSAWYIQKATGDIPDPRYSFCVVGVAAPDNSSFNIYLYGGSGYTNSADYVEKYYDDVYVLSLPSFTWAMVYGEGQSPRTGHTCHLVGHRQMLTVGGAPFGDIKTCDWESKGVAILDLTTIEWGSVYDANAASYQVPQQVISIIGGSSEGSATLCAPSEGFVNSDINKLFNKTSCIASVAEIAISSPASASPFSSSSTPTSLPQFSPTTEVNNSEIIGGVVGGVAGVILLSLAIWFFCIYSPRRQQKHPKSESGSAATLLAKRPQTNSRRSESDGLLLARPYDHMYQPITQTPFPNVTTPYPNISSIISPLSGATVGAAYTPIFPPLSGTTVGAAYTPVYLPHPTRFAALGINADNVNADREMEDDMRPLPLRVRPTHELHELGSGKSYSTRPAPVPGPVPVPVRPTHELHELGNGKSYSTQRPTAEEEEEEMGRPYAYVKLRPFSWEVQPDWNSGESELWLSRWKGKQTGREPELAEDG